MVYIEVALRPMPPTCAFAISPRRRRGRENLAPSPKSDPRATQELRDRVPFLHVNQYLNRPKSDKHVRKLEFSRTVGVIL